MSVRQSLQLVDSSSAFDFSNRSQYSNRKSYQNVQSQDQRQSYSSSNYNKSSFRFRVAAYQDFVQNENLKKSQYCERSSQDESQSSYYQFEQDCDIEEIKSIENHEQKQSSENSFARFVEIETFCRNCNDHFLFKIKLHKHLRVDCTARFANSCNTLILHSSSVEDEIVQDVHLKDVEIVSFKKLVDSLETGFDFRE